MNKLLKVALPIAGSKVRAQQRFHTRAFPLFRYQAAIRETAGYTKGIQESLRGDQCPLGIAVNPESSSRNPFRFQKVFSPLCYGDLPLGQIDRVILFPNRIPGVRSGSIFLNTDPWFTMDLEKA